MNLYELIRKHPEIQIDPEDLSKYGFWQSHLHQGYIYTKYINTKKALHLHIVNPPAGFEVDHEDRDKLNCTRRNLRIATRHQQNTNRNIQSSNTSGYVGVSYNKQNKNWRARIYRQVCGMSLKFEIGSFKTANEAAIAYNEAAKKYHGEFANFNVIIEEN